MRLLMVFWGDNHYLLTALLAIESTSSTDSLANTFQEGASQHVEPGYSQQVEGTAYKAGVQEGASSQRRSLKSCIEIQD